MVLFVVGLKNRSPSHWYVDMKADRARADAAAADPHPPRTEVGAVFRTLDFWIPQDSQCTVMPVM
jgi:hypothetical protein